MRDTANHTDIIVIGAGPIGLAMAAKLLKTDFSFLVLERGSSVGANVLDWGHISLFSNWEESTDTDVRRLLKAHQISLPKPSSYPTGRDLAEAYLQPLSQLPALKDKIILQANVTAISHEKEGNGTRFTTTYLQNGKPYSIKSAIVIDASGTWGNFNRLDSAIPSDALFYDIPDIVQQRETFAQKEVGVVGSGHSAMNSLQALAELELKNLHWLIRGNAPKFGKSKVGGRSDGLEHRIKALLESKKVQLHPNFSIKTMKDTTGKVELHAQSGTRLSDIDKVIVNAGAFPDYSMLSTMDLDLDIPFLCARSLAPKIDPKLHSCSSTSYTFEDTLLTRFPYFVVGMKSFGKASNFLLASGYKVLDGLVDYLGLIFKQ